MTGRRRVVRCTVAAGTLAVLAALDAAAPASAHNYLVGSTPTAGSTLTTLPARFEIDTNDVLLDVSGHAAGFALRVRDEQGRYYGDGCIRIDGDGMSTAAAIGAPGTYTVLWQVVSADGHTVDDSFAFQWAPAGGAPAPTSSGSATAPDCHGRTAGGSAAGGTDPHEHRNDASGGDVLWIAGGVALAVVAGLVALLLVLRRPKRTDP